MSSRAAHAAEADRGLHAVSRVRSVRERDSRAGLQQALNNARLLEGQAARLATSLDQAPTFVAGTAGDFLAEQGLRTGMAMLVRATQREAEASTLLAHEARTRWQSDKTRLRAVEYLLEKRAEARAAERARKEAGELDDVAGRLWLRAREERNGGESA